MNTSEVLNRAADLIEERGWDQYGGWLAATLGAGPLCVEGAIMAAADVQLHVLKRNCPAYHAVRSYIGDVPWDWNDTDGRTATEVVETLRACAVIEAAKETADKREFVAVS